MRRRLVAATGTILVLIGFILIVVFFGWPPSFDVLTNLRTVEIRGKSGGWASGGLLGHRQYVVSITVYNYGEEVSNVTVCVKAIQEEDFWIKKEKISLDADATRKLVFKFPEVTDYWFPSESQLPCYNIWLEYN